VICKPGHGKEEGGRMGAARRDSILINGLFLQGVRENPGLVEALAAEADLTKGLRTRSSSQWLGEQLKLLRDLPRGFACFSCS
jgi:hypothetical protein